MGFLNKVFGIEPVDAETKQRRRLERLYPELQGVDQRFENCSPSEIVTLIVNDHEFKPIFDNGVLPVPLQASITLQSVSPTKIVIYAGSRNKKFWIYTINIVQDGNDTVLTATVDYNAERIEYHDFTKWFLNIVQFNRAIRMIEV